LREAQPDTDTDAAWRSTLDEMREAQRLRHCAWETEKTYVGWVERFRAALRKPPGQAGADDVQQRGALPGAAALAVGVDGAGD
jgi:hypothetical protein